MPEKGSQSSGQKKILAGREVAVHGGGRISPRRDASTYEKGTHGARSPQQAIAIGLEQGAPGRYPTGSSRGRQNQKVNARERGARLPKRTIPGKNQDLGEAVARQGGRSEERSRARRFRIRRFPPMPRRRRRRAKDSQAPRVGRLDSALPST